MINELITLLRVPRIPSILDGEVTVPVGRVHVMDVNPFLGHIPDALGVTTLEEHVRRRLKLTLTQLT